MWEELLRDLLIVCDEAIMEDSNALLLIKYWVGLLVTHRVFARSVPRVQDGDPTLSLCLFALFLAFLNFLLVEPLVHLEEAIVLLVDNHLVLKHVLIICNSDHGHSQLLRAQTGELA